MICFDGSACLFLKERFNRIQTENTGFLIKEKTLFINLFLRWAYRLLSPGKVDLLAKYID